MIEKMLKYSFVLYHMDYESFLSELQKLGVVHLIKNTDAKTDTLVRNLGLIEDYAECVRFLRKLRSEAEKGTSSASPKMLYNRIKNAREERDQLLRKSESLAKQIRDLSPWGHFDYALETEIEKHGVTVDFHTCLKNHFKQEWLDKYCIEIINDVGGILYFVVLHTGERPVLETDTFSFHHHTLQELEAQQAEATARIADIDEYLNNTAPEAIELFEAHIRELSSTCEYESATLQGTSEAEDHIRVLGGYIPERLEKDLTNFLDQQGVIYFSGKASVEDNPPISLTNSWFARLFEPITRMYMLPHYNEFDLTPFFAPFFMLFFGFCNADMAYGVIFILLGFYMRWKAKNAASRNIFTLVIIFGVSSLILGWLMNSVLGFKLIPEEFGKPEVLPTALRFSSENAVTSTILFRNQNVIFNFALLLGAIQILFGVIVSAVKQARQSGPGHFLAPFGTFLFLLSLSVMGAGLLDADISRIQPYIKYPMWGGLALLLLFNSPGKNPVKNVLSGLWLLYNIVTGFFGDILSYIRLFALGVSSAILGFVINSIGQQMLGIKIIGPVIFLIFMLLGHGLNIALGALSGFVHSLRLTFVEFFKNAGFNGPGIKYNPFGKKDS